MVLTRFEKTTFSKLKEGDRFYFSSNRKVTCEFLRRETKKTTGITEYFYKKDSYYKETTSKKDLKVIYLRNINESR